MAAEIATQYYVLAEHSDRVMPIPGFAERFNDEGRNAAEVGRQLGELMRPAEHPYADPLPEDSPTVLSRFGQAAVPPMDADERFTMATAYAEATGAVISGDKAI